MKKKKGSLLGLLFSNSKLTLVYLMAIICIVMVFVKPVFFTGSNFINILRSMAVYGVLTCGVVIVMISGEMDLSFGSTVALTTILITKFAEMLGGEGGNASAGAFLGLVLAVAMAVVFGIVIGFLVTKCQLPSFFVTMGMQFVIYGIAGMISKGFQLYGVPDWWRLFGKDSVGPIPVSVIIFFILIAGVYVLMNHTKYGRTLYAIGGNVESARLSGIRVSGYKSSAFILMQVFAVVAGLIFSSQMMGGSVTYGKGVEFTVLISVMIAGGKSVEGTFLGLMFMNVLLNAMTICNIGEFSQNIVRGALLIAAMLLSAFQSRITAQRKIQEAAGVTEK